MLVFSDMNKCEQLGAQELLSMLNDVELMSVKDTVTKSMMPASSVREKPQFSMSHALVFFPLFISASGSDRCLFEMFTISDAIAATEENSTRYPYAVPSQKIDTSRGWDG